LQRGRYFIDSNVFFYAKIGDKKYSRCCQKVIREIFEGEMDPYIDTVVLLEVANALVKFFKTSHIAVEELNAILALPITVVEPKKEEVVASISSNLTPYDALHAYIANRIGAKVVSADKDFDEIGRVDPCDFT
jgi:predicted nucleic acid-binding protein